MSDKKEAQKRGYAIENLPGTVKTRFKILLSEKEHKEGRRIPYIDVKKEILEKTGISISSSTLSAWSKNKTERYDKVTVALFCDYFDCGVGDLIVYYSNYD